MAERVAGRGGELRQCRRQIVEAALASEEQIEDSIVEQVKGLGRVAATEDRASSCQTPAGRNAANRTARRRQQLPDRDQLRELSR